jgi:hypothetical protein
MFCNVWTGKNKACLGAHARNCKSNPKNNDSISVEASNTINHVELTIQEVLPDEVPLAKARPSRKIKK